MIIFCWQQVQVIQVASSYVLPPALQVACFLAFPVRTPERWRVPPDCRGLSERYLAFLQRFDAPSNSFPSMHTSVAMLTALHLYSGHGIGAFAFPGLLRLGWVLTKPPYVVNIPAGAALGWLAHAVHIELIAR